ncbi:ankyrin repeat domain-containing protein [Streptomyces sp. MS1.AVA.4]|uniref:Ankyrin repeat domain-containing protein n=2 Tax=Streptomyces TaxID=1883 RepID=A0ACC6QVB0_9ACTN
MKRFEHTSTALLEGPMSWSAGHSAVEHEDLPKLRDLLDDGYDIEDDNGDGWTLLRHAIDTEIDGHIQSGEPLHIDVTAFLLARGADPLRSTNGVLPADEADSRGHWLAAELIRAWTTRPATAGDKLG